MIQWFNSSLFFVDNIKVGHFDYVPHLSQYNMWFSWPKNHVNCTKLIMKINATNCPFNSSPSKTRHSQVKPLLQFQLPYGKKLWRGKNFGGEKTLANLMNHNNTPTFFANFHFSARVGRQTHMYTLHTNKFQENRHMLAGQPAYS